MRKTREEKAITLIALIITIVVLLILAVVAINAVTGDGIIQHATNAKTNYENAQAKEEGILSYYEGYLDTKGKTGEWIQKEESKTITDLDGNKVQVKIPSSTITKVNKNGTLQEIKVGTYVNYNPVLGLENLTEEEKLELITYTSSKEITLCENNQLYDASKYNGKWKVLGIENGKMLLISSDVIGNLEMNTGMVYIAGIGELNDICNIYGNGKGAESARSVKVEDVNRITGYNPELFTSRSDNHAEYGLDVTYSFNGTTLSYYTSKGEKGTLAENRLVRIIENKSNEDKYKEEWVGGVPDTEYRVHNNSYSYTGAYYINSILNMNMDRDSEEFKLIFIDNVYWLASRSMSCLIEGGRIANIMAGNLRFVSEDTRAAVSGKGATGATDSLYNHGIRPVIVLDENVDLVLNQDGTSYDIKI